ncbi:hypothetical protein KC345_g212 [Hortaea werneckii]|nr:hypothetical protein KC345_g212 [Hortaea werneckii]
MNGELAPRGREGLRCRPGGDSVLVAMKVGTVRPLVDSVSSDGDVDFEAMKRIALLARKKRLHQEIEGIGLDVRELAAYAALFCPGIENDATLRIGLDLYPLDDFDHTSLSIVSLHKGFMSINNLSNTPSLLPPAVLRLLLALAAMPEQTDSAAASNVCRGGSGTSAVGTICSAKSPSSTALSTFPARSATCSTTSSVERTFACSVSSFLTALLMRWAVEAAGRSVVLWRDRAAST